MTYHLIICTESPGFPIEKWYADATVLHAFEQAPAKWDSQQAFNVLMKQIMTTWVARKYADVAVVLVGIRLQRAFFIKPNRWMRWEAWDTLPSVIATSVPADNERLVRLFIDSFLSPTNA